MFRICNRQVIYDISSNIHRTIAPSYLDSHTIDVGTILVHVDLFISNSKGSVDERFLMLIYNKLYLPKFDSLGNSFSAHVVLRFCWV